MALKPGYWIIQNSAVGRLVIALAKVSGFRTVNIARVKDLLPRTRGKGGDLWIERNLSERFQTAFLNGATSMPLSFSALRSPRAMSTAPGVSP
jgi:hypothetical protein